MSFQLLHIIMYLSFYEYSISVIFFVSLSVFILLLSEHYFFFLFFYLFLLRYNLGYKFVCYIPHEYHWIFEILALVTSLLSLVWNFAQRCQWSRKHPARGGGQSTVICLFIWPTSLVLQRSLSTLFCRG